MGCICSKGAKDEDNENQREKEPSKSSKNLSKRDEIVGDDGDGNGCSDGTTWFISKPISLENVVPTPITLDEEDQKPVFIERPTAVHQRRATLDVELNGGEQQQLSRIVSIMPNGIKGEQVAAGWPSWLTAVAGEAIQGWVPRRADSFEKLDKIGQGTYSTVYKARDLETGKMVALKKVRFINMDPESVRFMAREIHILRRLDHPNIVKLEGLITSRMSSSLYLVFEYMEHDLAGLASGAKFTEPQIKCYMQQLLRGLEHCHSRGILHRDIKGSNLLIDNNGILRIADFGLATIFQPDQTQPLTSRVVTLWYRPPELLLGATEYGVAVDLWSTGCILAELLAGKPIMPGRTEVEQLHKIFKLCGSPSDEYWKKKKLPHATIFRPQHPYKRCIAETFKGFPPSALALMDVLLAIEPEDRGTASSALKSDFFTTKPLPCEPSSLPKYPPSKEFDAKLRDEEARRQRTGGKGRGSETGKRNSKDSKAVPQADANAGMQVPSQKLQGHSNPKNNTQEDGGSVPKGTAYSSWNKADEERIRAGPKKTFGSSINGPELRTQRSCMHQGGTNLSNFKARSTAQWDNPRHRSTDAHWLGPQLSVRYDHFDDAEPFEKRKWKDRSLDAPACSQKKDEKVLSKGSTMAYVPKKSRIHYSGPLMPPGGNIEEMLKEHERQIQQAVRKARLDKAKSKDFGQDNNQSESLHHQRRKGR
ncbi:Protein kinase domain [Macleaya cordata]|uniref:Protein kinase domain n=1 Tax=Macleaya cordata TaxID=56857 RepID=A0A200PPI6_MACCD|nr:Protein kinase domain [Macleaya cordata]